MKRLLALLLVIVMALGLLSGCAKTDDTNSGNTNDTSNILVGHYPEDRPCWDAIPTHATSPRIYPKNNVAALKSGFHFRFWFCLYPVI